MATTRTISTLAGLAATLVLLVAAPAPRDDVAAALQYTEYAEYAQSAEDRVRGGRGIRGGGLRRREGAAAGAGRARGRLPARELPARLDRRPADLDGDTQRHDPQSSTSAPSRS